MLVAGAAAGIAGWIQVARPRSRRVHDRVSGLRIPRSRSRRTRTRQGAPHRCRCRSLRRVAERERARQLGLGVSSEFVFVMQGVILYLMAFRLVGGMERQCDDTRRHPRQHLLGRLGSEWHSPLFAEWRSRLIGEAVSQRAGVLNLGLEGITMVGAFAGFAASSSSGDALLGLIAGAAGGAALALLMVAGAVYQNTNQIVTGFALVLFGQGLANFLYAQSRCLAPDLSAAVRSSAWARVGHSLSGRRRFPSECHGLHA